MDTARRTRAALASPRDGYPRGVSRPEGDATLTAMDRSGEPPRPVVELGAGARIGRYVIANRLGAGGMGVVYAARDTELAREVALKIVRPRAEVDVMQARLRREAKAMARLSHPNVVPVFDIGTHEGQLFIAMELVTGETLRSWVAQPRPWRSVVELFIKAGRGLEAAHAAGLLHRDFKPDNVVVGRGDEPRITDFGLARELDDGAGSAASLAAGADGELSLVTRTGSIAGTPAYMAPEQLLGRQAGAAADQFSFCVSLFEVLRGARPFRPAAPRPDAMIPEIRAGRIRIVKPPRAVPGWLHAAIVRGLAFEPDRRWPSMTALLDALDRGRRGRRLGVLAVAAAGVVAAGLGVTAILRAAHPAPASCLEVATRANDAITILVCRDEYARTNNPWAGRELADALRRTGKLREAATVATELLATPARAGALYTLGKVAADEGRRDEADRSFRLASELHRAQQQWADSAGDLQAMALASSDVIDQLVSCGEAARDARRGNDARIEGISHLSAAEQLSEIGARAGALAELERAGALLTRPGDLVQLELKRGDVHQNLGEHELAVAAFERARTGAEAVTSARLARSARLNLVYSLAEAGRLPEAAAELQAAGALDPGDQLLAERLSLEARVVARGGELSRAAGLIERSIATEPDADELAERVVQRAEIALGQGELTIAEQSARRAIALIEGLRSTHPPVELRSWLITERRIPYRLLVAILARRGDAAGALAAFERYRGLDVLAGLISAGSDPAPPEPMIAELARLFPRLAASALATPPAERALDDALRGSALLALVVVRDELWRFTADGGPLQVARLGALSALRPQLERFRAAPGDPAAAAALGDALIPPELARPSDRMLHVVLDEPLAGLPVAALRVGDRRLVAARPIVQSARVADLGCAASPRGPRRVVIVGAGGGVGDLAGRIPAAAPGATRSALLDAAPGDLLDVAAPIERDPLGEALVLGDGRVGALEIAGQGRAAAQVVLATPGAGTAGTTGLAMAFLAAGADQVVATIRPVSRATMERLADRLDRPDITDLARALAQLQRAADGDDWLGFAAFGREICKPQP
jgi:tetratricopeptide (TPR) repeat protein/predicted Ser/Thr protein kinase